MSKLSKYTEEINYNEVVQNKIYRDGFIKTLEYALGSNPNEFTINDLEGALFLLDMVMHKHPHAVNFLLLTGLHTSLTRMINIKSFECSYKAI